MCVARKKGAMVVWGVVSQVSMASPLALPPSTLPLVTGPIVTGLEQGKKEKIGGPWRKTWGKTCSWPAWVPSQTTPYPARPLQTQARPWQTQAKPCQSQARQRQNPGQASPNLGF